MRTRPTPTGLAIGAGAVSLVAAAIIAAAIPTADAGWRFAVMAIAVGLFAAISLDQLALAGIVVLAFLISNGFLEDQSGQLTWHGSGDLWRVLLLVMASAWGLALGEAVRFVANVRARGRAEIGRADAVSQDDEQFVNWANDMAAAAEVAGWTGARPIDVRSDESAADGRHVGGRFVHECDTNRAGRPSDSR